MPEKELYLFRVEGLFHNHLIEKLKYHGDDYGGTEVFTRDQAASSEEEAISAVWDAMEENCNRHDRIGAEAFEKIIILTAEGKNEEAAELNRRTIAELGVIPSEPKEREKWRAGKVIVPGYVIILRPLSPTSS